MTPSTRIDPLRIWTLWGGPHDQPLWPDGKPAPGEADDE